MYVVCRCICEENGEKKKKMSKKDAGCRIVGRGNSSCYWAHDSVGNYGLAGVIAGSCRVNHLVPVGGGLAPGPVLSSPSFGAIISSTYFIQVPCYILSFTAFLPAQLIAQVLLRDLISMAYNSPDGRRACPIRAIDAVMKWQEAKQEKASME